MALIEIERNPSKRFLRTFGNIALIMTLLIAVVLYLVKDLSLSWCAVIVAFGVFTFLTSLVSQGLTKIIYLGLTYATLPIGLAMSFIVLAIFYFVLLTPLGLIFRLIGRDALDRRFKTTAPTYWKPHRSPETTERYFRQF